MAIDDLGHEAISLTGSQAGIVTDTTHGKAKIVDVRARRIHEALDEDRIVLVAGFQGVSTAHERDDARPRRLRHDRGRARRGARRRALRDLHGRRRRLHRRPAARRRTRASCTASRTTRCSRWPRPARSVLASSLDRGRAQPPGQAPRPLVVRRGRRDVGPRGGRPDAREGADLGGRAPREETVYRVAGVTACAALRGARARRASTSTRSSRRATRSSSPRPIGDHARRRAARSTRLGVRRGASRDDLGKVSVVGAGMKSHPGVAAKTFATLDDAGHRSRRSSATSPIKIACHVAEHGRRARRAGPARGVRARARRCREARIGVVGATGAVGSRRAPLLRERGYDDVRALRVGPLGRHGARRHVSSRRRRPRRSSAGGVDFAFFAIGADGVARARPARGRRRRGRRRQVVGVPAGGRRPARRARGERRARARARRHRRHPELLHDPAHVRAQAAARRRRACAACASRPTSRRPAPARAAMERLRATSDRRARPRDGLGLRRRGVRRGDEAARRDAQDPRAARAADPAPRASACR